MNARQVLREARRRWRVQRALARGETVGGLGLLGYGLDAVVMRTPAAVDPVDRLLRYVNGAVLFPPVVTRFQAAIRQELGHVVSKAWRERRYPNLVLPERRLHAGRAVSQ